MLHRPSVRHALILALALPVYGCVPDGQDARCASGQAWVDGACVPWGGGCVGGVDSDGDGVCDEAPGCGSGADSDGDGVCDSDELTCTAGIDENGDGVCDNLAADWSRGAPVPEGGRRDIYNLGDNLGAVASRGVGHSNVWPIDVSGALLPWQPVFTMFDPNSTDPTVQSTQSFARTRLGFGTLDEMYDWLALARYDGSAEVWPGVPWPEYELGTPLGPGVIDTQWGEALTFSCATCHTGNLFGHVVVGLTNRRARANEFFHLAAGFFPAISAEVFEALTGADALEIELFERTQQNLNAIGSVVPQVLGLDTSLAQVSLSLARRLEDDYASHDAALQRNPRPNELETFVADSKPAVWWNLRYKNRWLSDGSIVSGNPVFTNFLWNEIGRGTDLHELEAWLAENRAIVDELTVAVFAAEAPRYTDFFGADSIDLDAAMRGEAHYNALCSSCHGTYTKAWSVDDGADRDTVGLMANVSLQYFAQTPVMDVGTDPQRAQGMAAFTDRLNALAISRWMNTVVEVQQGYVPPPLDGVWARYPYLHHGAIPTLCDLLTPGSERVAGFWMGPSENAETDFDADCVGYPVGDAVPASWTTEAHNFFDPSRPGLSNLGHDEWLTDGEGNPVLSADERSDLIEFLKTL